MGIENEANLYNQGYMTQARSPAPEPMKPARAVEALLGQRFPGHTMQRVRTPEGHYRYGYVGQGVEDLFGLDRAELMRREAVDHAWIHPEDRPRFLQALERSAADLQPLDEEVRVERPGGGYRWVRSVGHPRRQPDGTVIWDGVALDVDDRRVAIDALERTLSQVRQTETSDQQLGLIAVRDLAEPLNDLRQAVEALHALTGVGSSPQAQAVATRFAALDHAVHAATAMIAGGSSGTPTVHRAPSGATPSEPGGSASDDPISRADLSQRQREILRLVADGASNREIAGALRITEGTVKQHMSRIFRRLNVSNRTEASRYADPR